MRWIGEVQSSVVSDSIGLLSHGIYCEQLFRGEIESAGVDIRIELLDGHYHKLLLFVEVEIRTADRFWWKTYIRFSQPCLFVIKASMRGKKQRVPYPMLNQTCFLTSLSTRPSWRCEWRSGLGRRDLGSVWPCLLGRAAIEVEAGEINVTNDRINQVTIVYENQVELRAITASEVV